MTRSWALAVATVTAVATACTGFGGLAGTGVAGAQAGGGPALSVSATSGLNPAGQLLDVTGSGFATGDGRGIYVAFCAVPAAGQAPSPCGGAPGQAGGGAAWVAGDQYGVDNGATPLGADGSFAVQVFATPKIGTLDCTKVQCAVVTRADHRRTTDRSQDVIVPVSFGTTDVSTLPIATNAPTTDTSTSQVSERIDPIANKPKAKLPVSVDSADGRTVEVTDTSRVVVLNGSLAEVVYTLGLGDRVVGRDITATFKEAKKVPLVTRAHDVSAESVLSQRPTLVLAQTDSGPPDALQQIRDTGVPVVVFDEPRSIEEIGRREVAVAEALGVKSVGTKLSERTSAQLEAITAQVPTKGKKPTVAFLYMRGQAGVYLIGGKGSGADSMIEAAGGIDAGTAMGLQKAFTPITSEALAEAAPDVILMTSTGLESVGGIDGLVEIPGIAQTPAGKQRRIITEEDGLLFSFGARTPVALRRLVEKLHQVEASQKQP